MDGATGIWFEEIWMPYANYLSVGNNSLLLLDLFKCHEQVLFENGLKAVNTKTRFIPAGCTVLSQLVDV